MSDRDVELGRFLRSRREAVDPRSIDLPSYGARRVSGLRREELAMLAGVSVSYYTRIEQGQGRGVSPAVLDALARVLGLDEDERAHLHRLGGHPARPAAPFELLRPGLLALVRALHTVPAGVLGRGMDVLAWNRLAHALFAPQLPFDAVDDPGTRPNWARVLFLERGSRTIFVDWESTARDIVGRLRAASGRSPDDPVVADVVSELRAGSTDFERLWQAHPVAEKPLGIQWLHHPQVGRLQLADEVLRSAEDPDQILVSFHAEPGSPSAEALEGLAATVGGRPEPSTTTF